MLIFYYITILTSILGYGFFLNEKFIKYKTNNLGSIGLIGIFSLLLISYSSSQFIAHSKNFNLLIIILGILFFIYFLSKKKIVIKDIKILFFLFLISIVFILIYKNHDDFHYYHFPYTFILTEYSHPVGIGLLNIGFNTHSSIFYIASLFHLPGSNYNLFHLPAAMYMFFTNIFFLTSIYRNIFVKKNSYILFFLTSCFIFINIFFYRLAEHGTDRSAMILILIFIVQILIILNRKFEKDDINQFKFLIILSVLIISLKAIYILYLILFLPILIKIFKKKSFLEILKSYSFYLSSILFLFIIVTNFFNSGCLLFPEKMTCIQNINWGFSIDKIDEYRIHYENWAKAGAGAGYTNDDKINYIKNFNWLPNWIDKYFFNKVSDLIYSLFFLAFILLIIFKRKKNTANNRIKYKSILMIICLFLLIWFINYPSLRYGGYHLFFILIFLPLSVFIQTFLDNKKNLIKKISTMIIITFIIFFGRNIDRLIDENKKYAYNPLKKNNYRLLDSSFRYRNVIENQIKKNPGKIKEIYKGRYLIKN